MKVAVLALTITLLLGGVGMCSEFIDEDGTVTWLQFEPPTYPDDWAWSAVVQ